MKLPLIWLATVLPFAAAAQPNVLQVHAAGSLRGALTEIGKAFEAAEPGTQVRFTFGPSGLLKDRLAGGEKSDVFASANTEHPQVLADRGLAGPVRVFAQNALCVLAPKTAALATESVVDRLLDPAVRLGTSTPKADPAGDYTWQLFERIEQQGRAGAFAKLSSKALQITGGPNALPVPEGRNAYGALLVQGKADLFVTYCTNATAAVLEEPTLAVTQLPASVNVATRYGVTVMNGATPAAARWVDFVLGPQGQAVLGRLGFGRP